MSIKCGIVGLPNVGKSTLFNALTSQKIDAENFPFCTIEPNIARVNIPGSLRPGDRGIPQFGHPRGGLRPRRRRRTVGNHVAIRTGPRGGSRAGHPDRGRFPSHSPNHRHRAPLHPGPNAAVHLGGVRRASFSDVPEGTSESTLT